MPDSVLRALPVGLIVETLLQAAALLAVRHVQPDGLDERHTQALHDDLDECLEVARKISVRERAVKH